MIKLFRSMEIEVIVESENLFTGEKIVTNTGLFKFVSLNESRRSQPIRPIKIETIEEAIKFDKGKERYEKLKREREAPASKK